MILGAKPKFVVVKGPMWLKFGLENAISCIHPMHSKPLKWPTMHPHANVALGDGSVGQNNPLWEDQQFA